MCDDRRAVTETEKPPVDCAAEPAPTPDLPDFNAVLVRACIVAMWADGSMARTERNALGQLVSSVSANKREHDRLMALALKDLNRHEVLDEAKQLARPDRFHLFERCLALVAADGKLGRHELRFLSQLRRSCGIGRFSYQRMIYRNLSLARRLLPIVALLVVAVLVWVSAPDWPGSTQDGSPDDQVKTVEFRGPQDAEVHPELLLPAPPTELSPLSSEELYENVRRSVVTVKVRQAGQEYASGSGAVIGVDVGRHNYFVITNRHVVYHETRPDQPLSYEVVFENKARFDAVLDFTSRRHDLALLAVLGTPMWANPVAMRMAETLVIGEPVYALGSPMGLDNTFTSGLISALREQYIQTDATVHSGSSGGPLFDRYGLLCGVITLSHESKDLSFALVADTVIDMLRERHEVSLTPADSVEPQPAG